MISTTQIKEHRAKRKASGLMGCKTGEDAPLSSMRGLSWRPADPMSPHCFCHDCRTTWDPEGSIDLELINAGNERARYVYASLLPRKKETLMMLRCATDDALEDFVKAQMELSTKIKQIETAQKEYDHKLKAYRDMFEDASDATLKRFEKDMDEMDFNLFIQREKIVAMQDDQTKLEPNCIKAENALQEARKAERDFLDKNF